MRQKHTHTLSLFLCVCVCVSLSQCLCFSLALSLYVSVSVSLSLSLSLSLCVSFSMSLCLSLSLSLCRCLCLFLSLSLSVFKARLSNVVSELRSGTFSCITTPSLSQIQTKTSAGMRIRKPCPLRPRRKRTPISGCFLALLSGDLTFHKFYLTH